MKIEIKNYRACRGHEGDAFSFVLCLDGKRAAEVTNEGNGGSNHYHWFLPALKRPFLDERRELGRAILASWAQPRDPSDPPPVRTDDEIFDYYCKSGEIMDVVLGQFVDRMREDKALRRMCKRKILFRLDGDKQDAWRTVEAEWSSQTADEFATLKQIRSYASALEGYTVEPAVLSREDDGETYWRAAARVECTKHGRELHRWYKLG